MRLLKRLLLIDATAVMGGIEIHAAEVV